MAKHITATVKLADDRKTFELRAKLTHTQYFFGGNQPEISKETQNAPYVFMHGIILLGAYNVPCVFGIGSFIRELWGDTICTQAKHVLLFGGNNTSTVKNIPAELWEPIKEAIEAYNEFYKFR